MLEEKINNELKKAMKDKDALKVSTLRLIIAAMKNTRIEKQTTALTDGDVTTILKKQAKQRLDSIEQYTKANRQDLADKETAELTIIKTYLPEELSPEKIQAVVDSVISELGVTSLKDMGAVMKGVMAKTGGAADNKIVSTLVREKLSVS